MRRPVEIMQERDSMLTIKELTSAFEGIASMRIAQIKNQVESSEKFFAELWQIYSQIRVDALFHFGRSKSDVVVVPKELMILVTSGGSFSGDIDQRLIKEARAHYDPAKNDIIVIGHHGNVLLTQYGVPFVKSYKMPERDRNINVRPLAAEVKKYSSTVVFYESYESLSTQKIKSMPLSAAVAEKGRSVTKSEDIINEDTYIFEPSTHDVIEHLERTMVQITLSEVILESKLAQYASRFKAMTSAETKAEESYSELNTAYNRAKRHIKDERLKEVMNGLRSVNV